MKKYKHYYWLLDQRFDFLIPWFQTYFGIENRKDITFVGSFHGSARKGEEWEGVTKELVGINKNGRPAYIGQDSDTAEAQWLEPEDINRAYKDRIKDDSFVVAFSGANLPDNVGSFILTGETAAKLNNKWEQYLLLVEKKEIKLEKEILSERRQELREWLKKTTFPITVGLSAAPGSSRVTVIPGNDLNIIDLYCNSLSENDLKGLFFESTYVPMDNKEIGHDIILEEETEKIREELKRKINNIFQNVSDKKIVITDTITNYTAVLSNTDEDINWYCGIWGAGYYPNRLVVNKYKYKDSSILTPETIRKDLGEDEEKKEVLRRAVSSMKASCRCGKVVIKKPDLSGGYCMKVLADDCDFENYCSFLGEDRLNGQFLISEYIPHKQSFAGIGIVSRKKGRTKVSYLGTTEQVLYHDLAYEGLIWPPFWNAESHKSIQARKDEIKRITKKIGTLLAEQGYFGFYNVDFVEEEKTGRMCTIEINARFGFSTLFYALYCGKDCFFRAIQGDKPLVMKEENSNSIRRFLGKIKGISGKPYGGLFDLSNIENWYDAGGRFRTYYLKDEIFKYGSFAGLFGETIPMGMDRNTALVKFMDICLLRGKRMISMYVDSYCGFEQECFNFDIIKNYQIEKRDSFCFRMTKKTEAGLLDFWSIGDEPKETRNITSLSMMVGTNGSGKTTFMRLAIKWLSLLAVGTIPQETGAIVFGAGDGQDVIIAFSEGKTETKCDPVNLKEVHYVNDIEIIKKIFQDVGLLYYTDTFTDLELDREKSKHYSEITKKEIFIDNSKVNQLNIELSKDDYDLYHSRKVAVANRNLELRQAFRTWEMFGKENLPFSNIRLCVKKISNEAEYLIVPEDKDEEVRERYSELNELIIDLVKRIEKKHSRDNKIINFEEIILLRIFTGILSMTLERCLFKNKDAFIEICQIVSTVIEANMSNPILESMVVDAVDISKNYSKRDLDDLKMLIHQVRLISDDIVRYKSWSSEIEFENSQFMVYTLDLDYLKNNKEVEKKWIELLRLSLENVLDNLTSGNVYFDLGFPSSGESNKAGLYSCISLCRSWNKTTILSFLDEPDNSYHLSWKQEMVDDIIEKYNYFPNKTMQIFLSSHSPIVLSDATENPQIIFERRVDQSGNKIRKTQKKKSKSSFRQQMYDLTKESFDLESMVGSFALRITQTVDKEIASIADIIINTNGHMVNDKLVQMKSRLDALGQIVDMVDEPVVGNYLRMRYHWCDMELEKLRKEQVIM